MTDNTSDVLVTGATGYVGGRLVPELLNRGIAVRVLTRSIGRIRDRPWFGAVDVVEGDANDASTLAKALAGIHTAYYLIHALGAGGGFESRDRDTAAKFARAAEEARLGRIVYLGGIIPKHAGRLSPHLRSRMEVGHVFLTSATPTIALRAAVILGSGSVSFEMMRYLTERLPVMTTPTWVRTRIQPIAIRDVLWYLAECLRLPPETNRTFEICGPQILTYQEMMCRFAAIEDLPKRLILPVPVLSPKLSSYWVGLVSPVPSRIAKPLVESLRHEVVCHEDDLADMIGEPPGGRLDFDTAVRLATRRVREAEVAGAWSSVDPQPTLTTAPSEPQPTDPRWAGGSLYVDRHSRPVLASRERLWWAIESLVDRLDRWRVEARIPGRLLRLRAEMRLPGRAWLELRIDEAGPCPRLVERLVFWPRGLSGHIWWWLSRPIRAVVSEWKLRQLVRAGEGARAR
ncbi:MAG TPA: NAD(P)H-binding protein [Actinopolymorphaceae bacterium]|jgi:uncharacterized protein YbjT (DUF2867 family)